MIKPIKFFSFLLIVTTLNATAQTVSTSNVKSDSKSSRPKLVVGLVIDQMRWDYLYRYQEMYGNGGFKRLLNQGYSFQNTLIPYTPTYTAPGHTCIYTGSVPAVHGIVGNNWQDVSSGQFVYCTDDSTVTTVGSSSAAGKMSPRNMWATTITDELRLSDNFASKTIGIALKDRGAILPAGHSANAAYWYDETVGKFISSSYYMKTLPGWVDAFNNKDYPSQFMSGEWNTLFPVSKYKQSTGDDKVYESMIPGEKTTTFPHALKNITSGKYSAFKYTPFANSYSFNFAKAVIENEKMGSGSATDFLTLSISSTDYVGHNFGPNSIEIEDTYYRLDKDIADFLQFLDGRLGKGNYLLFLTADHGAAHVAAFDEEHELPGGLIENSVILKDLNTSLQQEFGLSNIIQRAINYQLYLNTAMLEKNGKDLTLVKNKIVKLLKARPDIVNAFATDAVEATTLPQPQKMMVVNGYNPKRSGEIMFTLQPGFMDWGMKGTTHGSWNPYDAHIPNVWFGWHIPAGNTNREVHMTDIAPTVAALLNIQMPSGSVGKVLLEVTK